MHTLKHSKNGTVKFYRCGIKMWGLKLDWASRREVGLSVARVYSIPEPCRLMPSIPGWMFSLALTRHLVVVAWKHYLTVEYKKEKKKMQERQQLSSSVLHYTTLWVSQEQNWDQVRQQVTLSLGSLHSETNRINILILFFIFFCQLARLGD